MEQYQNWEWVAVFLISKYVTIAQKLRPRKKKKLFIYHIEIDDTHGTLEIAQQSNKIT